MVVDTSILLAIQFAESRAVWAADRLNEHAGKLIMSTVNLAETLIRLQDRFPNSIGDLESRILKSGIRFVPPDVAQARTAARASLRFPLNLGDCFAYALAVAEDCPILTLDADFARTDRPIVAP